MALHAFDSSPPSDDLTADSSSTDNCFFIISMYIYHIGLAKCTLTTPRLHANPASSKCHEGDPSKAHADED